MNWGNLTIFIIFYCFLRVTPLVACMLIIKENIDFSDELISCTCAARTNRTDARTT